MKYLIATRGGKHGQCNICGEYGHLTEDHTPPKGCVRPTQVELLHITRAMSSALIRSKEKGRLSQNGVKFRTLCHRCNNTLLGAKYDPEFIRFSNAVGHALKSSLALPQTLSIAGKPQAIMRSLLGHMCAQGVGRYKKGPLTEAVRDYFLDTSLPVPDGLRIFYWAYPHWRQVMIRDAGHLDIRTHHTFTFWLMKFFPLAFMVTWDDPLHLEFAANSFDRWRALPYDAEVNLPLVLQPTPPTMWMEAPTSHCAILMGNEAMVAKDYSPTIALET